MTIQYFYQEYEPQIWHLVIYHVFAATIKQLFWSKF